MSSIQAAKERVAETRRRNREEDRTGHHDRVLCPLQMVVAEERGTKRIKSAVQLLNMLGPIY
jgi:hypothetical protein